MSRREFFQTINSDGNAIRVHFIGERGRIRASTVQYELQLEGTWYPVVRFDVAHGRVHCDWMNLDGETVAKDWGWFGANLPYNEAMTAAQREIKTNWPAYRTAFLRRQR